MENRTINIDFDQLNMEFFEIFRKNPRKAYKQIEKRIKEEIDNVTKS